MKKLSEGKKQVVWGVIISAGIMVSLYTFMHIAFLDVEVVCGRVTGESHRKGSSITYQYTYKGKSYRGSFLAENGLSSHMNAYENRCIDIEVSTLVPWLSRLKKYKAREH